jgi:HEAT repeat protein
MKARDKRQKVTGKRQRFLFLLSVLCVLAVNVLAQNFDDLAQKLRHGSVEEKRNTLYQIRNLQTAEASRLAISALRDKDDIVRATATQAVIFLPAEEALRVLLPLLKDK